MRALLVTALLLALPAVASADPIPLPPPMPHCPDGSRARLLWPSREGYCEPLDCTGTCARGTTCLMSCLCIGTIHGRTGPNGTETDLPNVVSACTSASDCPANAPGTLEQHCLRHRPRTPRHHAVPLKSDLLPVLTLGPLALAVGSIPWLRRRRK